MHVQAIGSGAAVALETGATAGLVGFAGGPTGIGTVGTFGGVGVLGGGGVGENGGLITYSSGTGGGGADPKPEAPTISKKPKAGLSGKEAAKDMPSWAEGQRPFVGEDGKAF